MEVGARVWISDPKGDDAWLLAEIKSRTAESITYTLLPSSSPSSSSSKHANTTQSRPRIPSTNEHSEAVELKYDGVELANHPLSESEQKEGKDNDMITLPHLHEPAILHAIGERFYGGKIYTWTGPVLIAVNPFQRLPLYTEVRADLLCYVLLFVLHVGIRLDTFESDPCFSLSWPCVGNTRILST